MRISDWSSDVCSSDLVQRELEWLYEKAGARVIACVGGMDIRNEQRKLAQGAHIVVGTPGRLRDHLERGKLGTGALRTVVLDEADEMLAMGFREELEELLRSEERREGKGCVRTCRCGWTPYL